MDEFANAHPTRVEKEARSEGRTSQKGREMNNPNVGVPTIYGEWREEEDYDPTKYQHHIRVMQPDGTEVVKAVDRYTYERAREIAMEARLQEEGY